MTKITIIYDVNNPDAKEEITAIDSGVTAIGYMITLSENKSILIHPAMVKKIIIEKID